MESHQRMFLRIIIRTAHIAVSSLYGFYHAGEVYRNLRHINNLEVIGMATLEGKRALITGAGGGMGQSHAVLMAKRGAEIIIHDIKDDGAEETADMVRDGAAVIDVGIDGLVVREIVGGLDFIELTQKTGAPLRLADDWRRITAPDL